MRILSMGAYFSHKDVTNVSFQEDVSLLDCDVLIWQSSDQNEAKEAGESNITNKVLMNLARRKDEMRELLRRGKTVIVLSTSYLPKDSRKSQAGLGAMGAGEVSAFEKGADIILGGVAASSEFWQENAQYLDIPVSFERPPGFPILTDETSGKILGFKADLKPGMLLFVPALKEESLAETLQMEYINALIQLVKGLEIEQESEIKWSQAYIFSKEVELRTQMHTQQKQLKDLEAALAVKKKTIANLQRHKLLIGGFGEAYVNQVKAVLSHCGFGLERRLSKSSFLMRLQTKLVLVKVLALEGEVSGRHAAELERSISEHLIESGESPKGILLVNAFYQLPLSQRPEVSFSDEMLSYSKQRDHCLMTSLQLLGLFLHMMQVPQKKHVMLAEVLNTVGVFEGYEDWTRFIRKDKALSVVVPDNIS